MPEKPEGLAEELVHFARVSLLGDQKQVGAYVRRMIRKLQGSHPERADELKILIASASETAKSVPNRRYTPDQSGPVDGETRLQLLQRFEPNRDAPEPILNNRLTSELQRVVDERGRASDLREHGLEPTRSILFVGPPGVGKTLTAHWLSSKLQQPLYVLNLASVMSSYLGRTGANIRNVLAFFRHNDGILFLDEFDAVAKKRSDDSDIGELRRLVTVILQELDNWPSQNLLIAATNHGDLLDPAVWRRFDQIINFSLPNELERKQKSDQLFANKIDSDLAHAFSVLFSNQSFSDLESEAKKLMRMSVINGDDLDQIVSRYIQENVSRLEKQSVKDVACLLIKTGMSQRKASEITMLSRDTIREAVKRGNSGG